MAVLKMFSGLDVHKYLEKGLFSEDFTTCGPFVKSQFILTFLELFAKYGDVVTHFLEVLRKMGQNGVTKFGKIGRFHNCNLLDLGAFQGKSTKLKRGLYGSAAQLHARQHARRRAAA